MLTCILKGIKANKAKDSNGALVFFILFDIIVSFWFYSSLDKTTQV